MTFSIKPVRGEGKVQERIDSIIAAGTTQAQALFERLQNDEIHDEVTPTNRIEVAVNDGRVLVGPKGGTLRSMNPHAIGQLATRLSLPAAWVRDEAQGSEGWRRERVADILASEMANVHPERLLFRSSGDSIRGVLSDSYRRLDSGVIANAAAAAFARMGAKPYAASCTDLRWTVAAMLPRAFLIQTDKHGDEYVGAAVGLGNSDYGSGTNWLAFNLVRIWCVNGAIGMSLLKTVHLGRTLPDDISLSQRTYRLDSETQASLVDDLIGRAFSPDFIMERLGKLQGAMETVVDAGSMVDGYVKAKRITKGEAEAVADVLTNRPENAVPTGEVTRYTMAQALSWVAKSAPRAERREEIEAFAGELLGV